MTLPESGTSFGQFRKKSCNDTLVVPFSVSAFHFPYDTSERGPATCLYVPSLRNSNASDGSLNVDTYEPTNSENATSLRGDWQEIPSSSMLIGRNLFIAHP